ncbi:cell wall-binding repeat-containing protein [Herbiconiux sp. CPCC 205763]|uniref:Cell wall-binding repeat-containing protein n=1 Tax=Herbiconiux aconitum TaxID=2970913 RepID=A0ABT2GPD4_9MICO|nr:cell wall-binding repeat-containing protein [Herbiconiux aconitum]MCS5716626.1 cell wall-binding repeat-containing protein [Herbiconiux aconitum]
MPATFLRRRRRLSLHAGLIVVSAALIASSTLSGAAVAAPRDDTPPVEEIDAGQLPTMSSYSGEQFIGEAEELPAELVDAVERDLGETPEDYLARSQAAVDAAAVVEALTANGMDVLGSRLDGTQLVVNVGSDEDASLIQSLGAVAERGEPEVPDYSTATLDPLADLIGGQGFQFLAQGTTYVCTAGFTGRYKPYPLEQFITSGHCIESDHASGTYYYESKQAGAGSSPSRGGIIGAPIADQYKYGGGSDVGAVAVSSSWSSKPLVSTWGGGTGALTQGTPVTVRDLTSGVVGSPLCKSGRTTGWTCGTILVVNESFPLYNHEGTPQYVNLTLTDVCMLPGDSGSAALIGNAAFGLGSAGDFSGTCSSQPNAISAFFPLLTTDGTPSITKTLPNWELGVALESPSYVRPSFVGDAISGTLAFAGPRHRVIVTIDGTAYSATPNAAGKWSVPIPTAARTGKHTFTVQSKWGDVTFSPTATDSYELLPTRPAVERISGANRYDVAVTVSQRAYPAAASVVYVANGGNYPDALSAAPAAVKQGGPLLLTPTDQLLPAVSAEISRLKPAKIVVVGGANSISEPVVAALRALVPDVARIEGADRYEVSRAVALAAFGTGAGGAPATVASGYLATGTNFPDALSASSAAGSKKVPVVLAYGPGSAADAATLDLFRTLGTTKITIAGGPNSVSAGVQSSLGTVASVTRLAGADRFAASLTINRATYNTSGTIYLATGFNFPDALAGGVLAGKSSAPLYVVPTDCVPRGVIADIASLKATKVVLLGGPNSLNDSVAALSACGW